MALRSKISEASGSSSNSVEPWRLSNAGLGARIYSTVSWLAVSTATFAALTVPRRKEWVDICLDYMYLKRQQYLPNVYNSIYQFLKKVPK
ncbi:uncharacterized protein LOC113146975 [Cyclospora cayetanensis]|uniref:Uncharacterized protein LOC113146975 n=1 Tax=Cyclospora cayetanensis TaxID=88456 RepID=A0A6P6RV26_9EIME|nr:uncharacterized protein LOC113146975 [Cyclospora cayetanensis]